MSNESCYAKAPHHRHKSALQHLRRYMNSKSCFANTMCLLCKLNALCWRYYCYLMNLKTFASRVMTTSGKNRSGSENDCSIDLTRKANDYQSRMLFTWKLVFTRSVELASIESYIRPFQLHVYGVGAPAVTTCLTNSSSRRLKPVAN